MCSDKRRSLPKHSIHHIGEKNSKADVNGDGEVNILDLVTVANAFENN